MFDGLLSGVTKVLIALGALMVLAFVLLVVLMAMERAKTPERLRLESNELNDSAEDIMKRQTKHIAYDSELDPEEIRYTRRMLAQKEEQTREPEPQPIYLPPPALFTEPAPAARGQTVRVQQDTIVRPARQPQERPSIPVSESTKRAPERTAEPVEPAVAREQPKRQNSAPAPRVFDYRKQAKPQTKTKQTITRVNRSERDFSDDEE